MLSMGAALWFVIGQRSIGSTGTWENACCVFLWSASVRASISLHYGSQVFACATSNAARPSNQSGGFTMKLISSSFSDGQRIPGDFAFCIPDPEHHVCLGSNLNPHLAWSDAPAGTQLVRPDLS
jgi:hypothetical protein